MAQTDTVTREESKKFLWHSNKEWWAFLPGLGSISLIVFGAMHFDECSGIPTLPAYCLTFGTLSILNVAIPFVFHVEKRRMNGESPKSEKFTQLVGLILLCCAVWGAAITWGETERFSNSPDCAKNVYLPGFISCTITLVIVSMMFVGFLISKLLGRKAADDVESESKAVTSEGADVENPPAVSM
jgi:hypothetical protein